MKIPLQRYAKLLGYMKSRGRLSDLWAFHWFFRDLIEFRRQGNRNIADFEFYPCLRDNTGHTPVEATYFFQDTWAASKISASQVQEHYDIGSSVMTMAVVSQFVPVTMIDIRPIDLRLKGFSFREGSILSIPAENRSVHSLSSLCVVEHIGLGRYGDAVDAFGTEKAALELQRVLAVSGNLYISVPIDASCKIYFNAHRAFTPDYIFQLLPQLRLVEQKYHYGRELHERYDPKKGFGTGLFHFRREY